MLAEGEETSSGRSSSTTAASSSVRCVGREATGADNVDLPDETGGLPPTIRNPTSLGIPWRLRRFLRKVKAAASSACSSFSTM